MKKGFFDRPATKQTTAKVPQQHDAATISPKESAKEKPAETRASPPALDAARGHAILVRGGRYKNREELLTLMTVNTIKAYGNWHGEMAEIKKAYGWASVDECGKFYAPIGCQWYYYVYGCGAAGGPANEVVARAAARRRPALKGDVIILRSGPDGASYDPSFSKEELADAILFNERNDPEKVFMERERARAFPGMEHIPGMRYVNTASGVTNVL